jgi:predicted PurR-regulated permease PerM
MTLLKVVLILLGVFALLLVFRLVRSVIRFKRSFEGFAEETGQRLLEWQEEVEGMPERWHEYDEAYQEALEHSQDSGQSPGHDRSRGATLGPTGGGSLRKPQ